MGTRMPEIFISYASTDLERARVLADALTNRGHAVWWDRTIPPGRVFDEVIQEAIQGARCMIVLWSVESVRSNWVKTEAAEGVARAILVPALIDDVAPPIEFRRIQSANLAQWEGDATHAEFRNLLESVDRLIKQVPRGSGEPANALQTHKPRSGVAPSRFSAVKSFGMGTMFALLVVGGFWLYGKAGNVATERDTAPSASKPAPAAQSPDAQPAGNAAPAAAPVGSPAPRGRVNLLSAQHGGQLVVASAEPWKLLIDGKEEEYAWTDTGFGVFGFRDGRTALIDTFALLIPKQADINIKDFELFAGNASPTGPFESIGRFSTQNMRMMQNPYQEFRFPPVKAKYLKFQPLRSHADSTSMYAFEIQLFGELQ